VCAPCLRWCLHRLRAKLLSQGGLPASLDSDVAAETEAAWSANGGEGVAVQLLDVRRVFTSITWGRGAWSIFCPRLVRRRFAAVNGVTVSFRYGQCFALLGHNGAGKSTTFAIICAQLEPTSGDVSLHGMSVASEAPRVRSHLGICPQHDILYTELTAREHLHLYGSLTGMTAAECDRCVPGLLHQVMRGPMPSQCMSHTPSPHAFNANALMLSPHALAPCAFNACLTCSRHMP
jgi:ABC-type glutathione transport system ATPase component